VLKLVFLVVTCAVLFINAVMIAVAILKIN